MSIQRHALTSLLVVSWALLGSAQEPELPPGLDRPDVAAVGSGALFRLPSGPALDMLPVLDGSGRVRFWVAKTEVRWQNYVAFCQATRRQPIGVPAKKHWDHPVNNLTLSEAQAFCEWAKLSLPSAKEWALAAYGPQQQRYPWGAASAAGRGNFCDRSCPEPWSWKESERDDGFPYTAPVGSFPSGAAPCGALDMGGNVWEWCQPAPGGSSVARGGGWCSPTSTAAAERAFEPSTRWGGLGFRPILRP